MAKGPETRLQRKIREALTKRFPDTFIFEVHGGPHQAAGIPDLCGCLNGRFSGMVVTVGSNKPTKLQKLALEQIARAGGISGVVRSVEEALRLAESAVQTEA